MTQDPPKTPQQFKDRARNDANRDMRHTGFKISDTRTTCPHPEDRRELTFRDGFESRDYNLREVCTECGHTLRANVGTRGFTEPTARGFSPDDAPVWATQTSVDELRARLAAAAGKCRAAVATLTQAAVQLEEGQQLVGQALFGSTQLEVRTYHEMIAEAKTGISAVHSLIEGALAALGSYSPRL